MNTDELRRLAEAATPGPYRVEDDEFEGDRWLWIEGARGVTVCGFADPEHGIQDRDRANADFIAAANPVAVLALLDRIAALEAEQRRAERTKDDVYLSGLAATRRVAECINDALALVRAGETEMAHDFLRQIAAGVLAQTEPAS